MDLYLDYETRSEADLKKVGAYRYAEDPTTDVLCTGWALDDGPVRLWKRGEVTDYWLDALARPYVKVLVWNGEFEREVTRHRFKLNLPLDRIVDVATLAARMGLPRKLEECCKALVTVQKDMAGNRIMRKLAKPRRLSKDNRDRFWTEHTKPEEFQQLYAYCMDDVEATRAIHHVLLDLEPEERKVWQVTIRMNERGLRVDPTAIRKAKALAEAAEEKLDARFQWLVGVGPRSPFAAERLGMESLDKYHVRDALKLDGHSPEKREALVIRQQVSKSSLAKLDQFLNRMHADQRVRGTFVYSGAERTQRWSGFGLQPQNFPKGAGKKSLAMFDALEHDVFDVLYPDVLPALSDMLRGFIVGNLLVGDFAQIEARVLAWMAGQTDLVEAFRQGKDPYCAMASRIYSRTITKADEKERFMGKQAVLSCGYGVGSPKFRQTLDEQHNTQISEDFAERVVKTYRSLNRKIVDYWQLLEDGFRYAVKNKSRNIKVGPVFMGTMETGGRAFATITLPSGRKLYYFAPHLRVDKFGNEQVCYYGRNLYAGGKWMMVSTYGGKVAENVTQATSRDLLAAGMVRLDEADFPLVGSIHDEVVADLPPEREPAEALGSFEEVLKVVPHWASGLPVGVECFSTLRYRK